MLQIENLSKRFFSTAALQKISFSVKTGEILGILGPNGAGKTTLFKIIAGILQPDEGRILSAQPLFPTIGYKPERLFFPEKMTMRQYLNLMANLCNVPPHHKTKTVNDALVQVGLQEVADKRIGEGSKGMRQRLGLAQALLGDPSLLVLDEPTDGLDPNGQAEIYLVIRELADRGKTVLISSHRLGQITAVCSDIAILNRGRLIYQNRMSAALADRPRSTIHVDRSLEPLRPLLESLHEQIEVEEQTIGLRGDALNIRRQILGIVLAAGYDILQIERRRASLAEIYSEVTRL